MALSRLAAEFAAEIRNHDWSDAPFRADRAGHSRQADTHIHSVPQLDSQQTHTVRANVMWVTAQVLGHADPNFEPVEFAAACGVSMPPGYITAGLRTMNGRYATPGAGWEFGDDTPR